MVVEVRSYSRISGQTSQLSEIATPGSSSARMAPARRSCASLVKLCRKQTATASILCRRSSTATWRTACSSSASSTAPSAATRSGTPKRRSRDTSGSGRSM